jgi:hypothetical protein
MSSAGGKEEAQMNMTHHAQTRGQQRGISNAHLKLIAAFGQTERRHGNATAIYLGKKGLRDLERILREGVQAMDKLKGQVVLLAEDDSVITCYHRTKRAKR